MICKKQTYRAVVLGCSNHDAKDAGNGILKWNRIIYLKLARGAVSEPFQISHSDGVVRFGRISAS